MSKTVLFSPLGGTDPISEYNCHDGALIHIARYYHPEKIYLYMSKEIMDNHAKDNRYLYCLDRLYERMGREYEYTILERPDLVEVHEFNFFYFEFQEILASIRDEIGEEGVLLLNISSGTPAMKSALMVLATLGRLACKTIQVATPSKGMNQHQHGKEDFRDLWEIDPDNEPDAVNRCEEVACPALDIIQQENHIKKMLRKYDYSAALEIAEELPSRYTDTYIDLLKMADRRVLLDFREVDKLLSKDNVYEIAVKDGNQKRIFEYALMLDIKLKRHEYADFIRAISPIITDLFIRIVKRQCNIDIEKYCDKGRWDKAKLQSNAWDVYEILDDAFAGQGGFKAGPVYALHLLKIAEAKQIGTEIISLMQFLRVVEEKLRNEAAHTMISVTEKTVLETAGCSSEQIMKKLKEGFRYAGINIKKDQWNDYDRMNDVIIGKIDGTGLSLKSKPL